MGNKKRKRSLELSDDIITDIISRVSEKDLTRFTSVSKSWRSSINSTDSYLAQLRSQRTALLNRPFLIIENRRYVSGGELYYNYWLELDSMEDGNPKPRETHNPFDPDDDSPRRDVRVIASCEGLLVLQQCSSKNMAVSNPTTKKHHVVPPNPAGDHNVKFIGFGYDHVHACYKLVTRIIRTSSDDSVLELMIYNVNNCTWKKSRFDGLDARYGGNSSPFRCSGQCVNGALYWYEETKMRKILCFVLAEEEFHGVDLPDFDFDGVVLCNTSLTVFDGRLCLVRDYPLYEKMEIWLMEFEQSYSPRWIKFLLISNLGALLPRHFNYLGRIPICFSARRNKILFNANISQLFWYDIRKNTFLQLRTPINRHSHQGFIRVRSCVPSLVGIGTSK